MFDHLDNPDPRPPTPEGARAAIDAGRRRVRRRRLAVGSGAAAAALGVVVFIGVSVQRDGPEQRVVAGETEPDTASAPAGGITGAWVPIAYSEVVVNPPEDVTLDLARDGSLTAHDGCNTMESTWREDDGRLRLDGPSPVTLIGCSDDEAVDLFGIIASEPRIGTFDGDPSTLQLSDGDEFVAFERAPGSPAPEDPPTEAEAPPAARECEGAPGSDIDVANEPNWRRWADYLEWTDTDGCLLRIDVLAERPGPEHCGWQHALVLITGDPIGTRYTSAPTTLNFVRDPMGVFRDDALTEGFAADAELPPDAVDSGYRQGPTGRQLWYVPGKARAVWIVDGDQIERWPQGDPPVCM